MVVLSSKGVVAQERGSRAAAERVTADSRASVVYPVATGLVDTTTVPYGRLRVAGTAFKFV